ncbi:AAA family ATPase [Enterococcus mundtii]|uniref:AAA family ATPase n=1 Tax=Enterococcus mundtii TaxID=53346 RepID=UPI000826952C|nr:AAA family ATPase [Enterococcus mundtii]
MKLVELIVKNFRGYKEETKLSVGELTALIGKNDAGKSTLLEALEIFFNNKRVICEREDLSVDCDSSQTIEISCLFTDYPLNLTIDSGSTTTLKNEYLLNRKNLLHIKKSYKCTSQKPKPEVSIICNHPVNKEYDDVLQLKKSELKDRAKKLKINESEYDARNNASIRKAIWKNCEDLKLMERGIVVNEPESKKIYTVLETYLPSYALFQSDRKSSDSDNEIADPMNVAISKALMGLEDEIVKIKESVQKSAIESAERTLEKLKEMDPHLANSLIPEFKSEPRFDSLFKLSIKSDKGISINKRGSGVRRLILLNFFRAEAERQLSESERKSNIIYAFEEPETSQHPAHQKVLFKSFFELSNKENCQVLLTTHTPALGELLPLESLRLITKNQLNKNIIKQDNEDIYEEIANSLGVLSEYVPSNSKGILLVEGKEDIYFFNHLTEILRKNRIIDKTFDEGGIVLLPTGGCNNLKEWVTLKLIEKLSLPWAVFLDSDRKKENERTKNVERIIELNDQNITAFTTKKREIENYFHPAIFDDAVLIEDYNDVKKAVNDYDSKVSKNKIISTYWHKMTFEQLRERETFNDENGNVRYELTEIIQNLLQLFA